METANVVFFYWERASAALPPKSAYSAEDLSGAHKAFLECGGLDLTSIQIDTTQNLKISKWKSAEGYALWLKHPLALNYLQSRSAFHKQNNIEATLQGPYHVSLW